MVFDVDCGGGQNAAAENKAIFEGWFRFEIDYRS